MARGKLRIYLGAAPGVGKTYAMLNEGWRRKQRGTDLVVGYVETHGRTNTAAQLRDLEVVPRRAVQYRDQPFEEMDVDAILARTPAVVLVDELAHTNIPGSRNAKRWQDVDELLAAGIEVISTVNIQHLESLNDVVERITGIAQRETIPDSVVRSADQVELVDMAPESLRRRMAHGNIYTAERVDAALGNYFRVGNLAALRELALLWVADKVDEGLQDYRERHGIAKPWETRERVVVALTGSPQGERLIRRAARMASRARAELVGVHIRSVDGLTRPSTDLLDEHRTLLQELGGRYEEITGTDVAKALVEFAQAENATQLLLGATRRSRWSEMWHGSVINQVIRAADGMDVHIISQRADDTEDDTRAAHRLPRLPKRGRLAPVPRRRVGGGWLAAVVGVPLLALAMVPLRDSMDVVGTLPVLLVGAIAVAAIGGVWPGVAGALVGFLLEDWLFIPPIHTFTISRAGDAVAGATFLLVAVMVSALVDQSARRRLETARARGESEALARLAGGAMATGTQTLSSLLAELRATFGVNAVGILTPLEEEGTPAAGTPAAGPRSHQLWSVQASAGEPVPVTPEGAQFSAALGGGAVLVLAGDELAADDRRLLSAFVAQLRLARAQGRLLAQAASAEQLSETNELRTALLAAVSHDLRTPLASIKAAATSLLSDEVTWAPEAVTSFCETINDEADRLNTLVGNLLDMSRLQTGVLHLDVRPVGLDEVVYAALASLSRDASKVGVDVPETLPRVVADAALLERAIANLIDNALTWSPPNVVLRVEAGRCGDRIDFRVVDRGPGIPPAQRDAVFRPFQRLGDSGGASKDGVGLGLAVAKGFVEAMGGELTLEDTPGGGLTSVISLPAALDGAALDGVALDGTALDGVADRGGPDAGIDTGAEQPGKQLTTPVTAPVTAR
ncbi:MAG: sensor histidine kinase KdpD [Actinomycetota bacterium]|nr:sensor histidine kinase KdpD [Actinomycetota bacterium]